MQRAVRTTRGGFWDFRLQTLARVALASSCFVPVACSLAGPSKQWAVAVFPSGAEFSLEIAADEAARAHGYMEREVVGPREGMLFLFDQAGFYPFWMKNCRVALDIIWLDEQMRVVDISHQTPACPVDGDCREVVPAAASRYVLEVAGGRAGQEGLKRGDRLVVMGDPRLPK